MLDDIQSKFLYWKKFVKEDVDLIDEINSIENDEEKINDAFYKDLEFGTGGLRGIIGVGSNRMNIFTVRKASQGLANYVNKNFKNGSIAISFDSRIKSDVFAKVAAEVFAANGLKVFIYKNLMPTPCLSYAVRELKCSAGIMVTASHNPSKYNGYKVYGNDGCQITSKAAEEITLEINSTDQFVDIKSLDFNMALKSGKIEYISDELITKYINRVKEESMLKNSKINKDFTIVYSPLNGTGLVPVTRILKECGFENLVLVKEQEKPDGNFPTCPFPNPEIKEALELGIKYAKENNADLLIATDPDCDRVGIAIKDKDDYVLLSGNETGVLLLDYIYNLRTSNNTLPTNPHIVKTIVTTNMVDKMAEDYNLELHNVLTGFKYIGNVIKDLENKNDEKSYIFGFEESYGYLSGSYVRDKDAVDATLLIAEMFAYYKNKGISLLDKLNELYNQFGYYLNITNNYVFEGSKGALKMKEIMSSFRETILSFGNYKIKEVLDYKNGIDGLPKSDVIKFFLDNESTIVVRPSGTEPKLKLYYCIKAKNKDEALKIYNDLNNEISRKFN